MKDKVIKEVLEKKISKLSDLASQISDDFDKDAIHDFRTTTKSFRSFLRLLRTHVHKKDIKLTKDFKRLYHIAGTFREAQLESDSLTQMQLHLPAYLHQLEKKMELQKSQWTQYYHHGIIKTLDTNLSGHDYGAMNTPVLKDFLKEKLNTLATLTDNTSPTQTEIHQARKDAKDVVYNFKTVKKHWEEAGEVLAEAEFDRLDKLCDTIGDYLDGAVRLDHLSAFHAAEMKEDEADLIGDFCDEESSRLLEEKASALSVVAEFVTDYQNKM